MKSLKEYSIDATYIYNLEKEENFFSCNKLVIGKNGIEEYRTIFNISLSKIKKLKAINENIKLELGVFLTSVTLDSDIDSYMLDIGVNKAHIDIEEINYLNYPKFTQQYTLYKIDESFENKYINFDITHVLEKNLNEKYLGVTLLGLNDGGKLEFSSSNAEKKPYLKIFYENEINEDEKEESKVYGYFISKNQETVKCKDYEMISWDKTILVKNLRITENKRDIVFLKKGVYQIDYSLNIRSEGKGYIFLNLNNEPLKYSFVQTTYDDHMYSGHYLIEIKEEGAKLNMCIAGGGIIIIDMGFAGNLRVLEV